MGILQSVLLGILQGLTEFLPVSSSGHLVIVPWLLGWANPGVTFDAVLHVGTALAIVAVFWRDLVRLIVGWFASLKHPRALTPDGKLAWLLIVSAIPAALLGYFLSDFFESLFGTPRLVAALLIITGIILWLSETLGKRTRVLSSLTWLDALLIGVAQGVAIAPGISRSGATLAMGLVRGLGRQDAARFSFIIAIPVIAGAAAFKLLKADLGANQVGILLVGFLAAAITGYAVIRFFLNYVQKHSLKPFAIYCAAFGIFTIIIALVRP